MKMDNGSSLQEAQRSLREASQMKLREAQADDNGSWKSNMAAGEA